MKLEFLMIRFVFETTDIMFSSERLYFVAVLKQRVLLHPVTAKCCN